MSGRHEDAWRVVHTTQGGRRSLSTGREEKQGSSGRLCCRQGEMNKQGAGVEDAAAATFNGAPGVVSSLSVVWPPLGFFSVAIE